MTRPKKFEALVAPERSGFAAEEVRRRTSVGTRIERMAGGFASGQRRALWRMRVGWQTRQR
jgi:hypothetical protein